MNEPPFGREYAAAYDALYREKDYWGEVELVRRLLAAHATRPVRSILDLGTGTGSHAVLLAESGVEVVGVDRSEAMLETARRKAESLGVSVGWVHGDVRTVTLGRRFDAALLLFAVLSYQLENGDVLATLRTARRHLEPGGVLVADVWYGPAVLAQRPGDREVRIRSDEGDVVRRASATLDTRRHRCEVRYRLTAGGVESEEVHSVRFFFPLELELFLRQADLELVRLGAFPEVEDEPSEETWNALVVARAA
jgi:SAM-dependent methyltransferase